MSVEDIDDRNEIGVTETGTSRRTSGTWARGFVAVAAVAVIAVAAGAVTSGGSRQRVEPHAPTETDEGDGDEAGDASATGDAAKVDAAVFAGYTFHLADGVVVEPRQAPVFRWNPAFADPSELATIVADALNVTGETVTTDSTATISSSRDDADTWTIDVTKQTNTWSYNRYTAQPLCAMDAPVVDEPASDPTGVQACEFTTPATADEVTQAVAATRALFEKIGIGEASYSKDVTQRDGTGVLVSAVPFGSKTNEAGLAWYAFFDSEGTLQYAGGAVGSMVAAGTTMTVTAREAVERLQNQQSLGGSKMAWSAPSASDDGVGGEPDHVETPVPVDAATAEQQRVDVVVACDAELSSTTVCNTPNSGHGQAAIVCEPSVSCSTPVLTAGVASSTEPSVECTDGQPCPDIVAVCQPEVCAGEYAPVEPTEIEPTEIELTAVRVSSVVVYDSEDTVWLEPAYVFTGDDGSEWTITAGAETHSSESSNVHPVEDGTVSAARDVAEGVVGLTVLEAQAFADAAGVTVRVVYDSQNQDGLALTADYVPDRVGLTVVDGIVTTAEVG